MASLSVGIIFSILSLDGKFFGLSIRNMLLRSVNSLCFLHYPSQVKRGRSLEILYWGLFKNAWRSVCVCLSPHSPPTSVKVEAWKLACIILTWMTPKTHLLNYRLHTKKINLNDCLKDWRICIRGCHGQSSHTN